MNKFIITKNDKAISLKKMQALKQVQQYINGEGEINKENTLFNIAYS